MPKQRNKVLVVQSRELVKESKRLCDASRERIERRKRLSEDIGERTSRADEGRIRAFVLNVENNRDETSRH